LSQLPCGDPFNKSTENHRRSYPDDASLPNSPSQEEARAPNIGKTFQREGGLQWNHFENFLQQRATDLLPVIRALWEGHEDAPSQFGVRI
jgi:hypothetical protein